MNWRRILNWIFPYIEGMTAEEKAVEQRRYDRDIAAIETTKYTANDERALDEAQKVAAAETERVRTAEGKATTYLAVLAALVPVIITLQAANWEKKAGPAPDAARLFVLAVATVYVAAAGFHAFMTLQVRGFQRVGEAEIAAAWRTPNPLRKLTRGTLLAARRSRDTVNAKITRIRVTHEHLLRAFGTFVLLLLLDPLFYAMGYRNAAQEPARPKIVAAEQGRAASVRKTPPLPTPGALSETLPGVLVSVDRPARNVQPAPIETHAPTARTSNCPNGTRECVHVRHRPTAP